MQEKKYFLRRWIRSCKNFVLYSGKTKKVLTIWRTTPDEALSIAVDLIAKRERVNQEKITIYPITPYVYFLRVLKAPKPKT
jgi:hypothetical protein